MTWRLGLDSWIIQDGNYGDFACGQRIEVAVECVFSTPAVEETGIAPSATYSGEASHYAICANVVHRYQELPRYVLDCGTICLYTEGSIAEGIARVASPEAELSVDCFTYFERLAHEPFSPPLVYTWNVDAIYRETTPETGWRFWKHAARTFVPQETTDAWNDGGRRAHYILECTLTDVPPKWDSATAVGF